MLQAVKRDTQAISVTIEISSIGAPKFIDNRHLISWLSARLNVVDGIAVKISDNNAYMPADKEETFDTEKFLLMMEMREQLSLLRDLRKLRERIPLKTT